MEVGVIYDQFPLFCHFIDQVRDFPHVAPHPFVCALDGYYNLIGDQYFTLDVRYSYPKLPHWKNMYHWGQWIRKWVYPKFGKPIMYFKPEYYGQVTQWVHEQYENWRHTQLHNFGIVEKNMAVNYLSNAADRLMSLKTQRLIETPPRTHLNEISPYITQSNSAATYLNNSTTLELAAVPDIVNEILSATLRTPPVSFSRLSNIEETVRYDEVEKETSHAL